jgi:hypothetical protein
MKSALATVLWMLVLSCGSSDNADETIAQRCTRMRDHLVDLRLNTIAPRTNHDPNVPADRAAASSTSIREQHRTSVIAALGEDFANRCASTMTATQIDCVLEAADSDAASACTR